MSKPLSEMTLEELWQLFPIFLTEHQDCWADWYREEESLLREILGPEPVLSHIGSTAVKGIWAKPIVDILIEAPDRTALGAAKDALKAAGYLCMADSGDRVDFNKGYTPEGFAQRVFHLHLRLLGDHDELYFRDYLNAHPEDAKEYEGLKLGLWKEYEHDRDEYTRQKTEFVRTRTARAKELLTKEPNPQTLELIEIMAKDAMAPEVLELFSLHDDFMLEILGGDNWFYHRYSEEEHIQQVWTAYEGELTVGCIAYRKKAGDMGEVKRLFIKEAYRGRGLSKRLLKTLEAYAREQGCRALYLDTRTTLEPAVALYYSSGFRITFQDGLYIQMEKPL